MTAPIVYEWTGEAMVPLPRFRKAADAEFVIGERYTLEEVKPRSKRSHDHYFASLQDAWLNLPERLAAEFPTAEHLRKRALVEAGFYTETIVDAGSRAAAQRVAAYARGAEEFAAVATAGPMVVVRRPKSQSLRSMGREEFQRSKDAVLAVVVALVGAEPSAFGRAA